MPRQVRLLDQFLVNIHSRGEIVLLAVEQRELHPGVGVLRIQFQGFATLHNRGVGLAQICQRDREVEATFGRNRANCSSLPAETPGGPRRGPPAATGANPQAGMRLRVIGFQFQGLLKRGQRVIALTSASRRHPENARL